MTDQESDNRPREGAESNGNANNGDIHASPDATLGGYIREHSRPPAFEGVDGEPYTVSIEIEKTGNLLAPYQGYLVFPRWAATGLGVLDHVETPTLLTGKQREKVERELGQLPLVQVKVLLDQAIRDSHDADGEAGPFDS